MNSANIYDDLHNTDLGEKVEKLKEYNTKLLSHAKALEGDIEKLCKELTKMKRNEDNLKKNISSLFKTSKVEIERKDKMIAELRKQLDDLLFRRSNMNNNIPSGDTYFNKRRYETSEPDPNMSKRKKSDLEDDSHKEIIKSHSVTLLKTEHHRASTRARESSKSISKSPSTQGRSRSRHRIRYRDRKYSRSRDKYRNQSRNVSRERDEYRGRNNLRSGNRNQKDEHPKDLREVLSNRKSKEESILKNNEKNCNTVIKEALHRISSRHNSNRSISAENICNNSKPNGQVGNSKSNKGTIITRNGSNKKICSSFNTEYKTVQITTEDKQASPENILNEGQLRHDSFKHCIGTDDNSSSTENSKPVTQETDNLKDISTNAQIINTEGYSPNHTINNPTDNFSNGISFSDTMLEVVHNSRKCEWKTTTKDFSTNSDTNNGAVHEHNITVSNFNNSGTGMNVSRRKRCVIKIVT